MTRHDTKPFFAAFKAHMERIAAELQREGEALVERARRRGTPLVPEERWRRFLPDRATSGRNGKLDAERLHEELLEKTRKVREGCVSILTRSSAVQKMLVKGMLDQRHHAAVVREILLENLVADPPGSFWTLMGRPAGAGAFLAFLRTELIETELALATQGALESEGWSHPPEWAFDSATARFRQETRTHPWAKGLVRLLNLRFGSLSYWVRLDIEKASRLTLNRWTAATLTAPRIEETVCDWIAPEERWVPEGALRPWRVAPGPDGRPTL